MHLFKQERIFGTFRYFTSTFKYPKFSFYNLLPIPMTKAGISGLGIVELELTWVIPSVMLDKVGWPASSVYMFP